MQLSRPLSWGPRREIEAITDVNEGARLRERLRTEGDWKSGSMFLIIFLPTGEPFIHGNDQTAESKNLLGVVDDNGLKVVEELLAAAARGGGFVKYHDGEPKTAYAVTYTSGITGRGFVLVGGYSQDVSHVPLLIADLPLAGRHRIAGREPRDTHHLRRGSGQGVPPRRPVRRLPRPYRDQKRPFGWKEETGNQAPSTCGS